MQVDATHVYKDMVVGMGLSGWPEEGKPQDLCQSFVRRLNELNENEGERLKY